MTSMTRRWLLGLVLAGLVASLASSVVHYRLVGDPSYVSFCDVGETVSCTQAYLSRFGTLWGIPVAVLGSLWFLLVGILLLTQADGPTRYQENVPTYVFLSSTIGLAVVLYLAYASFVVLGAVCLLCIAVYVAVTGIFLVSGSATTVPVSQLPQRAGQDLAALGRSGRGLAMAGAFLVVSLVAIVSFPSEQFAVAAAQAPELDETERAEFLRWWAAQPRVELPEEADGATVVVVKFNDYMCPPCRQTYLGYQPIFDKWEASHPGAVRLVTKDYPLDPECNDQTPNGIHLASCEAAVAVRLARRRDTAEALERWLFDNQPSLTPGSVRSAASTVAGVDDFDEQYSLVLEDVKADIALGTRLRVEATPTFVINGVRVTGGLTPQFFDAAIAYELEQAAMP